MKWLVLTLALAGGIALALWTLVWALHPPALPVPEARDRIFRNLRVSEPGRPLRPVSSLVVRDGRIVAIGDGEDEVAPSPGLAEAPDLAGLVVVPGLIDLHVHYPPRVAVGNAPLWSLLLLAHGVTSVRETGSIDGSVFAVRRAIRAGRRPGPRIFACGSILDGDPPAFPSNRVVTTPEEGRRAVAEQAAAGADCIKAYNLLAPEVLAAIREAASEAGLPLIGHVPHAVAFEGAGLVDVQHGTGAVLVDRERVGRMDFHLEDWETMDEARIDHVARVSRARGIAHTPTLVNGRLRRLLSDPEAARRALATDTGLRHLPGFWVAAWRGIWGRPFTPGDPASEALHTRFRMRQRAYTGGIHARGARVHAGTDTLMPFVAPGSSLHGELEELLASGIPPQDAWAAATAVAGEALPLEGLGRIEAGAPADLLFLREDPRGDLGALRRIEAVLAAGRLYRRADLERGLERFDAHFHGWPYAPVMDALGRLLQRRFAPEGS